MKYFFVICLLLTLLLQSICGLSQLYGLIPSQHAFFKITGKNYQNLKEYDLAEECFIRASNIIPSRHYPFYLLAKLYVETGVTEKACEMAIYVIEKKPKIESQAIEEMKNEMRQLLKDNKIKL